MTEGEKPLLCIIPARGGLKRIPRKNLAVVGNRSLLEYAIETALAASVFHRILVSSEDAEILEAAARAGAEPAPRPSELAGDNAQYRQVCAYHLREAQAQGVTYDSFCVLIPNNPLRTAGDVAGSLAVLRRERCDVVMSVVEFDFPPQRSLRIKDGRLQPFLNASYMLPGRQLETLFRHDGMVLWARVEPFLRTESFYDGSVAPYVVPVERSLDIDTPIDLEWARFLVSQKA